MKIQYMANVWAGRLSTYITNNFTKHSNIYYLFTMFYILQNILKIS